MSELDQVSVQVEQLKHEVAALRRQRWGGLAAVAGALLLFGARAATTANPPEDLTCKSLHVVGPDGKDRASIGIDEDGGLLTIRGNDAKVRMYVGLDKNGGLVDVKGTDGVTRSWMGAGQNGGMVDIRGNDGKVKSVMTMHDNGAGGYIGVKAKDDNYRAIMSADENGGVVNVRSNDGKSRVIVGISQGDVGELDLRGDDDKDRLVARGDKAVGSVEVFGPGSVSKGKLP